MLRGTGAHSFTVPLPDNPPPATSDGMRKAPDGGGALAPESDSELVNSDAPVLTPSAAQGDAATTALAHDRAAATYILF